MDKLLTTEQLAERWQCDERTIERLKSDKKDPNKLMETKIRSLVRFRMEDIEAFERTHTRHFLLSLANRTNKPAFRKMKAATSNDQDEHDPNDLRWFHDFLSGKVNE